ncbi:Chromatin-associated protein swi6 [Hypsizygus marmoreus]|uniref:Chromatin-associated protein swi6 n=1 Tax=Hypsizygus marmoreus TaxID=39966 RepID=A0A369J5W0_HYPMA|nr:Chromatin-associated protein swi6 [Hypsizygus marmoreus]
MARVSPARSDNESGSERSHSRSKTKSKKADDMEVDEEENGGSGSEEESEYEIEAILDAKKGSFPEGRMGYLVKWKGYGESENSWVDEKDAGNADALIEEYWRKNPKKARKSLDAKTPKRPRKSVAAEDVTESAAKKRGRKSQVAAESAVEDDADATSNRAAKKARKSAAPKQQPEEVTNVVDEDITFGDMSQYMNVADWEGLVKSVDTIERGADDLLVYFTLTTDERVRENTDLCYKRFPQKMLKFYEGNLRWKTAAEHEEDS